MSTSDESGHWGAAGVPETDDVPEAVWTRVLSVTFDPDTEADDALVPDGAVFDGLQPDDAFADDAALTAVPDGDADDAADDVPTDTTDAPDAADVASDATDDTTDDTTDDGTADDPSLDDLSDLGTDHADLGGAHDHHDAGWQPPTDDDLF